MKNKSPKSLKSVNKTISQIYDEYRDEMKAALTLEDQDGMKFAKGKFERRVHQLDTLIALYWDLLLAEKSDSEEQNNDLSHRIN